MFEVQLWFIFSILAVFALAVAEIIQQKILVDKQEVTSATETSFFTPLSQFLFFTPVIFLLGLDINIFSYLETEQLLLFIVTGFFGWYGVYFYLRSFEVENISLSVVFAASSIVVSAALGFIFLEEEIYLAKTLGIILVILSIVLVSLKSVSLEKNHKFALLGGLFLGVLHIVDSVLVDSIHPFVYFFWMYLSLLFFGFLFNPKKIIARVRRSSLQSYKRFVVSGFGYFIFNAFVFYAYYYGGEAARIDAINNFEIFLIIIFEYFILKQRKELWLKIAAFVLGLGGVLLLGFL